VKLPAEFNLQVMNGQFVTDNWRFMIIDLPNVGLSHYTNDIDTQ